MIRAALVAALAAATIGPDPGYRDALELLYDGSTDTARERLAVLAEEHPDDPMGDYLQALALVWKIEQRPSSTALDGELQRRLEHLLERTAARLRAAPTDARARLARGGAYGLRSRFFLFRGKNHDAAKAAEAMRRELLPLREAGAEASGLEGDAAFGLGLYDYYVDVLPRAARVLRFLSGMPGGDRARGLAAIEEARDRARFHATEASWQLYEIYAYYEHEPDLAWAEIHHLHEEYPGSPLWALKLAEHERLRLGRYAEAAAVAREIVRAAERGEDNYGPVVAALGRLALAEALLLDLRTAEARRVLTSFRDVEPWLALRARLLQGQALELEGDRDGALAHYRAAAQSSEPEVRDAANDALRHPRPEAQVRAAPLLADGRRAREAGRIAESVASYRAALEAWPSGDEARLRVAEHEIREGSLAAGRAHLAELEKREAPFPPWVRPWTGLLRAWLFDLSGQREDAVRLYKQVLNERHRDDALAREARSRLRQPLHRARGSEERPEPH
jgi:hypothetical protein